MPNFVPIVTIAGRAADQASKIEGGPPVRFSQLLLGDGNGATPSPTESWTQLVNQRATIAVNSVTHDLEDPTKILVSAAYQQNTPRGFTIRELALTLLDGTVYAVAAVPETFMPLAAQGAMRLPTFKIPFIETPATGNIVIFENPGNFATQEFVINLFESLDIPDIPPFASIPEHLAGLSEVKKCHPKGVKAMIDALAAVILPLIPAAFTQSVIAPLAWDSGARIMSLRAATKALTGFGRAATDVEASTGVTNPGGGYAYPWMTPEQVAAAIAARDTSDYAIGTTVSAFVPQWITPGTSHLGQTRTGAQLASDHNLVGWVGGAEANLPGSWKCIAASGAATVTSLSSTAEPHSHDFGGYALTWKRVV